jgi:hypothetical protein
MFYPLSRTDFAPALFYNPAVFSCTTKTLSPILLASVLWGAGSAQTSTPAPQNTPKASAPDLVTCGEKPPLASHTIKGNVLSAPDQKHRAYTEVEATALYPQRPSGYAGPLCVNNSRLFISDAGDFKLRFLQEPADIETGNSLRLVDWSADGRRLLIEISEWQNEQPGVTRSVLVFDSRTGTFQQPDLARSLAKAYGHDCAMNFRVQGFGLQGTIILDGDPLTPEEEEILGTSSCAKKKTYFELDRTTENLVSVPEMPKVQHNAKLEGSSPSK